MRAESTNGRRGRSCGRCTKIAALVVGLVLGWTPYGVSGAQPLSVEGVAVTVTPLGTASVGTASVGSLSVLYRGAYRDSALAELRWTVPEAVWQQASAAGPCSDWLVLGSLVARGSEVESFRMRLHDAELERTAEDRTTIVARHLRPETYRLTLTLASCDEQPMARFEGSLWVPVDAGWAMPSTGRALPPPRPAVQLVDPGAELFLGRTPIEARVWAPNVAEVRFTHDGELVDRVRVAPYRITLRLGQVPRVHDVTAEAYDPAGRLLAADRLVLNARHRAFALTLLEPAGEAPLRGTLKVHAAVQLPPGRSLARLEIYRDQALVATLYQPPFIAPLRLEGEHAGPLVVRAVAVLDDGRRAEDVVLVGAPGTVDSVEVHDVELWVGAFERRRPRVDLEAGAFTVYEDGIAQKLDRFVPATELPLHLGILLDVSPTMRADGTLQRAVTEADRFLGEVLRPQDRVALFTFREQPELVVPFTDRQDALRDALEVAAEPAPARDFRGTAIFDSLVMTLHHFEGRPGRHALLVITDGDDNRSRFRWREARDHARRSNARVYVLLMGGRPRGSALQRLARDTGGLAFAVRHTVDLPRIYRTLAEELRSQYVLGYQSSRTVPADRAGGCRQISVEIAAEGGRQLEARTVGGYCR